MSEDRQERGDMYPHMTDELLEQLLASATPEAYLARASANGDLDDRDLAAYLSDLLETNGVTKSEAIRNSGLNSTFTYQVFAGTRRIMRDRAVMLAFGLHCDVRQTQRLLTHAGQAELYSRNRRDAIILYCIEHGFTRAACDDELYRLGEEPLFDGEAVTTRGK